MANLLAGLLEVVGGALVLFNVIDRVDGRARNQPDPMFINAIESHFSGPNIPLRFPVLVGKPQRRIKGQPFERLALMYCGSVKANPHNKNNVGGPDGHDLPEYSIHLFPLRVRRT